MQGAARTKWLFCAVRPTYAYVPTNTLDTRCLEQLLSSCAAVDTRFDTRMSVDGQISTAADKGGGWSDRRIQRVRSLATTR